MNWDRAVDHLIDVMRGVEPVEVEKRAGIPAGTYRRWRRDRAAGKSIGEPRGAPKEALMRALDEINGRKELLRGGGEGKGTVYGGDRVPEGEIPTTYRGLLQQMERVLAASEYAPEIKLELLGRVNDGMRIAGLMAEGELSRERIRALVDERELSRHRQGIIGGEQDAGRDRAGRMGGDAGRIPTREEMESEARRLVSERDEAAAKEPKKNHS